MRVLLADDQPEIRSAIRLLLEQEEDLQVVGESAEAETLLHQARTIEADVVLLDWELPCGNCADQKTGVGERLVRALSKDCPGLRVVVLSGRPEARYAAVAAGADAFVSKGDPPDHLLDVLQAVGVGRERPPTGLVV